MLRKVLKLEGAKALKKSDLATINGGGEDTQFGICFENGNLVRVPCDCLCADGTDPIGICDPFI